MVERLNALGQARRPFFFCIDFEKRAPIIEPLDELSPGTAFCLDHYSRGAVCGDGTPILPSLRPIPFALYARRFDTVQEHIRRGNTYLLNLTAPTPIDCPMSLEAIYAASRAPFKLLIPGRFVLFSPERFIRIDGTTISTYPMKGTIDADLPEAAATLLADPKEHAEHTMVVDLLRNDLAQIASGVRVRRYRYIEPIAAGARQLLQTSSHIAGELEPSWPDRIGSILDALLPAGSVSGTPKRKTLEIIRTVEEEERGYFTGVFGIFDGTNLDSAVMIRYIEQTPDGLVYRSGGGITADSDPLAEYRELLGKVYVPLS